MEYSGSFNGGNQINAVLWGGLLQNGIFAKTIILISIENHGDLWYDLSIKFIRTNWNLVEDYYDK